MLKGETEQIGKLLEHIMMKKYGPANLNQHFLSFNTICDATPTRLTCKKLQLSMAFLPITLTVPSGLNRVIASSTNP
jgi:hypothetical protein